MPKDEWRRANNRARYGPVRYDKPKPRRYFKKKKPRSKPGYKFEIPVGTVVSVCRDNDPRRPWQRHQTRKRLRFYKEYKTKKCRGTAGAVIFRKLGYLILTKRDMCTCK